MIQRYDILGWIAEDLNGIWRGKRLLDCFSKSKTSLVLAFDKGGIEFCWLKNEMWMLKNTSHRTKKDIPRFQHVHGQKVMKVEGVKFDRSFLIHFESGDKLWFKAWGAHGNILAINKDEQVIELFRPELTGDLVAKVPALNEEPILIQKNPWQKTHAGYIWKDLGPLPALELACAIGKLEVSRIQFEQRKFTLIHQAEQQIKMTQKLITKNKIEINKLETERPMSELADNLMAHLHLVDDHSLSLQVNDIYNNEPISITWKYPDTARTYAEKLYRKAKNRGIELRILKEKTEELEAKLSLLTSKIHIYAEAQKPHELSEISVKKSRVEAKSDSSFRQFEEDGIKIYIGKSGEMNARLLREKGKKNNWWFHAAHVPGAHVIVDSAQNLAPLLIEKAAGLAAGFSKAKGSKVVPVWMTRCKYVRQVKGGAPGQVIAQPVETIDAIPISSLS